ncbi:hypothetical protein [Burkholderia mayonis]|uniref:Uncharacterized protein n=1 Tax=Burkholderia mayonis TaxID=1385591 RepID=A0A1B4FRR8_9BURK|nr:hypothetical protein [Burkholderia mayonis]AOJ06375.1 hypothetical protein WS71_02825 [Burkholderia mayonis]KVE51680.1 hypothetical protein WS71_11620 [Burkholderia mayonis]
MSHGTPITNSNVVNVQFGEREKLVEYVTPHQKRIIARLVERIVEATEEEPLEVWRKVLARAGAPKAKLILKSAYIDVEEYLVEWLGRATQMPAAAPPAASPAAPPVASPGAAAAPAAPGAPSAPATSWQSEVSSPVHLAACPHCEANRWAAASARFNMKVAVGVLGGAALAIAFLGYKAHDATNALYALRAESTGCTFEGRPYAVGSIIDNPSAPDIECIRPAMDRVPEWQTLKPSRVTRR